MLAIVLVMVAMQPSRVHGVFVDEVDVNDWYLIHPTSTHQPHQIANLEGLLWSEIGLYVTWVRS